MGVGARHAERRGLRIILFPRATSKRPPAGFQHLFIYGII
jgi:hypothetical protein